MAAAAISQDVSADEQAVLVKEALNTIKQQTIQMKKCLDSKGKLMDALKHASTFLSELRTLNLTPKHYYELYIAIYDSLEYLGNYLKENHPRNHLSKLYELVQYAGNIIPRLYLMITVGTVYMTVSDAPIKEIMRDMMEMCRGVQHPVRGLFLRYYLSQRTKSLLPEATGASTNGNLQDSVQFVITNFVEMNKLWVRLQHQGHSRERKKRTQERKELQILVGSNLVRLSQLEGVNKEYYKSYILPAILEQIIQCRDMIAQEYLLDVIIQVFPDEFHLFTLKEFLDSTVNLIPQVSLKKILTTLLDRLTNYRETLDLGQLKIEEQSKSNEEESGIDEKEVDNSDNKEKSNDSNENKEKSNDFNKEEVEDSSKQEANDSKKEESNDSDKQESNHSNKQEANDSNKEESNDYKKQESNKSDNKQISNPENNLFTSFYSHFLNLHKMRPDLTIDDISALYYGLLRLSLVYYPDNFSNIDMIYLETLRRFNEFRDTVESSSEATEANLKNILLIPLQFSSITGAGEKLNLQLLFKLEHYQALLEAQTLKVQVSISNEILTNLLKNNFKLENQEQIEKIFQVLEPIIFNKETKTTAQDLQENTDIPRETRVKQENLARLLHLVNNKDSIIHSKLLSVVYNHLNQKNKLIKYVYPSLIFDYLKLIKRLSHKLSSKKDADQEIKHIFQTLSKLVDELYGQGELELSIKLLISIAEMSNQLKKNEFTNEFFIKIFSIYEELVSSRLQYELIVQIIATLIEFYKNFQNGSETDQENYDSLITKTVLYSAKLLKKPDQCRAVFSASHFWFQSQVLAATDPSLPPLPDDRLSDNNKRVLECLQKSLRISDSCIESAVSVELFVEILNQCIYYYIHGNLISATYINNLIELIKNNLADVDAVPINHFKRTLDYISRQKEIDERFSLIRY